MPSNKYDHQQIEEKWLNYWQQTDLFQDTEITDLENKMYLLFAFPYPSGSGLHVGHTESLAALDIMARYYRMAGKDVFFPVGWDAFGLPAENYAIKTGIPPVETTKKAIDTFREQISRVGISYDWQTEIATCHPGYYRWTQWLFKELFSHDLAYKDIGMVNWCPSCQTVLANEQVVEGLCERCDSQVNQKELNQWYFRITDYRDELIEGLAQVDWPHSTKAQQQNWIGRSEGVEVDFKLKETDQTLTCFTTRIDTIYGATFIVVSPEKFRQLQLLDTVEQNSKDDKFRQVEQYLVKAFEKTEEERKIGEKEKTGVKTNLSAINPVNGQEIPVFVADYVLGGVGTGVVMGVPAHDERDFEFAQKYNLEVLPTNKPAGSELERIRQDEGEQRADEVVELVLAGEMVWPHSGVMVNSEQFNDLTWQEAQAAITKEFSRVMRPTTNYKLRDWLISRQRYWGAPIPVIYDPAGNPHLVPDEELPWKLPEDVDFKPTGESPLKSSQEFRQRAARVAVSYFQELIEDHQEEGWAQDGSDWMPEFDTMDTFVDSSWYYLRYIDPRNQEQFARKERLNNYLPVDFYLIGPEHIVLHLLYSRFFTKFLRDQGYLDLESGEPFAKMRHQGMILGPDGKKMSKSKGNVINPDEIVEQYGADTLRVYEMFMGPLDADKPWDDRAVAGVRRFLDKVYSLVMDVLEAKGAHPEALASVKTQPELATKLHQTICKVGADIPELKFNTAIAALMELSNEWRIAAGIGQAHSTQAISLEDTKKFVQLLAPFAPFMAEELWHLLGEEASIHQTQWPEYDPELAQAQEIIIPVQVNGKIRGELILTQDELEGLDKAEIITRAKGLEAVGKWLEDEGSEIISLKKEIYVPGKIVSLVK